MSSWWLREKSLLLVAAALRLLLVAYGDWQDAHLEVRYTDIDYHVFSDAAALLARGKSPFDRETYRYSPLLALLLVPNSVLHPSWGKLLFSAADILAGHLIYSILSLQGICGKIRALCTALWLFNPFTFTIGTRGNCEAIICCLILRIIYCLHRGSVVEAAVWYGLAVHFRIYPIIYVMALLIVLDRTYSEAVSISWKSDLVDDTKSIRKVYHDCCRILILVFRLNRQRILFGAISGGIFFILTAVSYGLFREKFLQEALFYHLTRTDPRHNFSIYFYHIYLHHSHSFSMAERLISFVPQFLVQCVLTTYFARDVSFCFFVQTVAFVAFNKVITAQYFVWFFCLIPLILPWTTLSFYGGLGCVFLWAGTQLHWLSWAYALEFQGHNVFYQLWMASLAFFVATVVVLSIIIFHHRSPYLYSKAGNIMDDKLKESKSH